MPWQLRKLSTNEVLEDASVLPTNWGPIFGLAGVKDQLGDLSWVGLDDQGWFEVSPDVTPDSDIPIADMVRQDRNQRLTESDWAAMPDTPMTAGSKAEWYEYRKALRDITQQPGFPSDITWPAKPE